jgi:hypothetical protein
MLVEVTFDAGPVPTAQVKPTAQALWDLKEYQALREKLQAELKELNRISPSKNYARCRKITGALWKACTMTSHSGRMRVLRAIDKTTAKAEQATLFG